MLLSKLAPGAAKPLTRPEEVSLWAPRSVTDGGSPCLSMVLYRSVLQAKPRCSLNGLAPWVPPSPPAVGRCILVWSYSLVHVSGDAKCYLPR
jgi:hypothetical protein